MSMFSLVGYKEAIQPIALKMGLLGVPLEPDLDYLGKDWNEGKVKFVKHFTPKTRYKPTRYSLGVAPHTRAYDGGGRNDQDKAVDYALWLAGRDKIKLPKYHSAVVEFESVTLEGYKYPMQRAARVHFGQMVIHIPHVHYDPTIVPKAY